MTPRCSPIDNCLTWEREKEEILTLHSSQPEPVAGNSTTYVNFDSFSLSHVRQLSMDCTWRSWIQVFPKFMVLKSSSKLSKTSKCKYFHLFLLLYYFFNCYAILMWGQEYMTCLVIHQTKPTSVEIHHAKGLWDWSTYKGATRGVKMEGNFWTHCMRVPLEPSETREFGVKISSRLVHVGQS